MVREMVTTTQEAGDGAHVFDLPPGATQPIVCHLPKTDGFLVNPRGELVNIIERNRPIHFIPGAAIITEEPAEVVLSLPRNLWSSTAW